MVSVKTQFTSLVRTALLQLKPGWSDKKELFLHFIRCEFTNSGGWTVIQYRHDGSQDFYQSYEAYKAGFGDVKSEHWLGLNAIHQLTMDINGNPKETRVKVELIDAKNHKEYVEYDDFYIYGEPTGFR